MARAVAPSTPWWTKSDRPCPSSATTPIAAYRAPPSSAAVSQSLSSVWCSSVPEPTERIAASSCGIRTASSAEIPCGPGRSASSGSEPERFSAGGGMEGA